MTFACLYNDAYRSSDRTESGTPASLGRPAREVWDEIWEIIGPQIERRLMEGRGATWHENQPRADHPKWQTRKERLLDLQL